MARYIDADKLLSSLPDDLPHKASVKRVLIQSPAEDVVPKSEVKETVEKLMSATDKVICEAKQDVAREIFEDIHFHIHQLMFVPDEERGDRIEMLLTELKKKYTEDK